MKFICKSCESFAHVVLVGIGLNLIRICFSYDLIYTLCGLPCFYLTVRDILK